MVLFDLGGVEEAFSRLASTVAGSSYSRAMAEAAAAILLEAGMRDPAALLVAPFPPGAAIVDDWTFLTTATAALHVRAELGDAPGAADLVERLSPFSGRWSVAGTSSGAMGLVDLALARGLALLGHEDRAAVLFDAAVTGHERMRTPAWLARTLVHQGRFLCGTDSVSDADRGRAALSRAGELADRHGLVYVRRRLDQG